MCFKNGSNLYFSHAKNGVFRAAGKKESLLEAVIIILAGWQWIWSPAWARSDFRGTYWERLQLEEGEDGWFRKVRGKILLDLVIGICRYHGYYWLNEGGIVGTWPKPKKEQGVSDLQKWGPLWEVVVGSCCSRSCNSGPDAWSHSLWVLRLSSSFWQSGEPSFHVFTKQLSLHCPQTLGNLERRASPCPDLVDSHTRGKLGERHFTCLTVYREDTLRRPSSSTIKDFLLMSRTHQICDNLADASQTRQREITLFQDFVLPILIHVVHEHNNFGTIRVRDEIHGASHPLHDLLRDHIVRKITSRRNF